MTNKKILIGYKLLFALLGTYALLQENITLMLRGTYDFINFWSYFTNQSNLFAVIILMLATSTLLGKRKLKYLDLWRGASVIYMIVTGVVFTVLLSGGDNDKLTAVPIDNIIMHQVMPIALLVDWLINPPARRIHFVRSLLWLIYPLGYAFFTMLRGAITNWYPYEFLNPSISGYGPVYRTIGIISIFVIMLAWILIWLPSLWDTSKKIKKNSSIR